MIFRAFGACIDGICSPRPADAKNASFAWAIILRPPALLYFVLIYTDKIMRRYLRGQGEEDEKNRSWIGKSLYSLLSLSLSSTKNVEEKGPS